MENCFDMQQGKQRKRGREGKREKERDSSSKICQSLRLYTFASEKRRLLSERGERTVVEFPKLDALNDKRREETSHSALRREFNYSEGNTVKYIFERVIITSFWEFTLRSPPENTSAFITCVMKKRFFMFPPKVTCDVTSFVYSFKSNTHTHHIHEHMHPDTRYLTILIKSRELFSAPFLICDRLILNFMIGFVTEALLIIRVLCAMRNLS